MDSISHPASNLVLRHPTWPSVSWLAVAEAEHVKTATPGGCFSQAADVALALAVFEDMEEPAVEHGVELLAQINEADDEARLYPSFGRLRLGQLDGPHRHVDPHRFVAE